MEQAVFLTEIGCAAARSLLFLPHSSTVAREDVVEYSFFACASHGRKEDEARGEGTAFFPRSFRVAGGGRICLHCAQENKFGPVRVRLLFCHDASPACLCRGIATASPPPPPPPPSSSSSPPPRARAASIFTASMKILICISLHAIHVMRLRAQPLSSMALHQLGQSAVRTRSISPPPREHKTKIPSSGCGCGGGENVNAELRCVSVLWSMKSLTDRRTDRARQHIETNQISCR